MSFADIKPYFRQQLAAVGYTVEHDDAVNLENVPAVTLDRTYHLLVTGSSFVSATQSDQTVEANVTVSVFYAGYANALQAMDNATSEAENILKSCVNIAQRTTQPNTMRNVQFISHSVQPLAGSNDNITLLQLDFSALCVFNID